MVPTPRLAALLALALLPASLAIAWPAALWLALGWDALIVAAFLIDLWRCPARGCVEVRRQVEDVVSAGAPNPVQLVVENLCERPIKGAVCDTPPTTASAGDFRRPFALPARASLRLTYLFNPANRGDHVFGEIPVRLEGPWGLALRQHRCAAPEGGRTVRAYPDLEALGRDALKLARAGAETGLTRLRRARGDGRQFESLREYVPGDDIRLVDWKATARLQRPIARQYEPERNQTVLLMLDCGRHMVSRIERRTKLDHAVDAALRLARASLDRGDQVGLCAFGARVIAWVPPKRGRAQLQALVDALYPLQPELVESNYHEAFNLVAARQGRRSLIATFTDLLDDDSSRVLLERTLHLRPRHLPLIVATEDSAILEPARAVPGTPGGAYARAAARRIVHERERSLARLRDAGAMVVSVPATELSAAAVNAYLDVKGRGML